MLPNGEMAHSVFRLSIGRKYVVTPMKGCSSNRGDVLRETASSGPNLAGKEKLRDKDMASIRVLFGEIAVRKKVT